MRTGLIAQKMGMTRLFGDDGSHVRVTVLQVEKCEVVAVRTPGEGRLHRRPARRRHAQGQERHPADARPFRQGEGRAQGQGRRVPGRREDALLEVGAEIHVGHFVAGQFVDVCGVSIGKGFAGAMKRLQFRRPARDATACRSRTAATARPATGRIRAGCSRARRWPATWATGRSRCRTSRCSASIRSAG